MGPHDLKKLADQEMRNGRRATAEFLLGLAIEKLEAQNAWLDAHLADLVAEREEAEREAARFGMVTP